MITAFFQFFGFSADIFFVHRKDNTNEVHRVLCLSLEEEDIAKSIFFVNKQDTENDMNQYVFEFGRYI